MRVSPRHRRFCPAVPAHLAFGGANPPYGGPEAHPERRSRPQGNTVPTRSLVKRVKAAPAAPFSPYLAVRRARPSVGISSSFRLVVVAQTTTTRSVCVRDAARRGESALVRTVNRGQCAEKGVRNGVRFRAIKITKLSSPDEKFFTEKTLVTQMPSTAGTRNPPGEVCPSARPVAPGDVHSDVCKHQKKITLNGGSLGSWVDEERS